MTRRLACTLAALLTASLLAAACGSEEDTPRTPATELADLAWELMEPLDVSNECEKIGDALEPWLKAHGERFAELVGQVESLTGANAKNLDTVKRRLETRTMHCVNPKGPTTPFTKHDARVAQVAEMFPKGQLRLR